MSNIIITDYVKRLVGDNYKANEIIKLFDNIIAEKNKLQNKLYYEQEKYLSVQFELNKRNKINEERIEYLEKINDEFNKWLTSYSQYNSNQSDND